MDVEKLQADMRAAAEAGLKRDAATVRAKINERKPPTPHLFDALESIGATMDPMWEGEWEGPVLFNDPKGASRLILVTPADHDEFLTWATAHPNFTDEELQEQGRAFLVRMCARPVNP